MKPTDQIQTFLAWFSRQGVDVFDIHVRSPRTSGENYKNGQWIWLTQHEAVSCEQILTRLGGWLKWKNANGSDIFFRPHKNGFHKVIFLDDIATTKAIAISRKYGSCAVETHPGNTQIWLSVDKMLSRQQRKQAQAALRDLGFTDPGSVSGDHLGRLCGFVSQKRKCWVNIIQSSDLPPWSPDISYASSLPPSGGACASKRGCFQRQYDSSASGREWGWVLGMLRIGINQDIVIKMLINAAQKRGKINAVRYAHHTVQKAIKSF